MDRAVIEELVSAADIALSALLFVAEKSTTESGLKDVLKNAIAAARNELDKPMDMER